MRVCKYCGCDEFTAKWAEYHDCIVDGDNNWIDDLEDLTIEVDGY